MAFLATIWNSISGFLTSIGLQLLKWVGIYYIFTKPERMRRKLTEDALERSMERKDVTEDVSNSSDDDLDERLRRYQRD